MSIQEIEAKSILRKHKKIDSWFISHYGMNLYRGCSHNCTYCDGRAEKYNVEGDFGKDIAVKKNAPEILSRELDPNRKRVPFKKSYLLLGGGVCDAYQPAEKKYKLTRQVLRIIQKYNLPVHILTKSTLVDRDIDILKEMNKKNRIIISMSFSSVNDKISSIFEPGVPSPKERLKTLKIIKKNNIATGIFLLPVIPFITDSYEMIEDVVKKAKEIDVDFIIFGGMTLKKGRQQDYYYQVINKYFPEHIQKYYKIYQSNQWGSAVSDYYKMIYKIFINIIKQYKIYPRIPPYLFKNILNEDDYIIVLLEHIDYLLKSEEKSSPYGYAAYSISQLKQPISGMINHLQKIKGVGSFTEKIIKEILNTKRSSYYESLLKF